MSNKVKLRNKRLRLEYRFKKAELDEVLEKKDEYTVDFNDFFLNEISILTTYDPVSDVPKNSELEDVISEEDMRSHNQSKEIKALYRKIVDKTHPDKLGDNNKIEEFQEATEAYRDNNAAELINLADDLGLETPELNEETVEGYKKGIDIVSKKVSKVTDTFAWAWGEAETDEDRDRLKKIFYKFWGITEEEVANYKQDKKGE
jgi:hypothetical protein